MSQTRQSLITLESLGFTEPFVRVRNDEFMRRLVFELLKHNT